MPQDWGLWLNVLVKPFLITLGLACTLLQVLGEPLYPGNREPLSPSKFVPLPLGAVKPDGWLKQQLNIQAHGLTGHLDEFWPDLKNSAWKGLNGDAWERGPYYLDGLVPLAYQLDDERLKAIAQPYLDFMLSSSRDNGWFGPAKNQDRWPLSVALKVLTQYYDATQDPRALKVIERYFAYLLNNPPDWPDREWRGVRAQENLVSLYWLYNRTGNPDLLRVADSIHANSFDWVGYFRAFPYTSDVLAQGLKYGHLTHVVNIAMAVKHPSVWYQQSNDPRDAEAARLALENLDRYHGQVGGRFAGDEHISGPSPTQGTELCAVVELMYSLENMIPVLGDVDLADRLEMLAYNGLPGACTPDFWAHQYDQQANQVLCSVARRKWSTNDDTSNLYGLEPNFGCCTANMHQGWPKFVSQLWMATPDRGVAAVAYGPCSVTALVANDQKVVIRETTDYPFAGNIRLDVNLSTPAKFPLVLRIPSWARDARIKINHRTQSAQAGTYHTLQRVWRQGDVVELQLPMAVRTETRHNHAVSVLRGPLVYALNIKEEYFKLKSHHETLPVIDWEIRPGSAWNFALAVDPNHPSEAMTVTTKRPGPVPFHQPEAPVVLTVQGRQVSGWGMDSNSAGDTPFSPVFSDAPLTRLELIPYGCARLRISEFPILDPSDR